MLIYKSAPFDVSDMSEKGDFGYIKGIASFFGNVDSDNDIIDKGAYNKTLQENRQRIKYCEQHDIRKAFGTFDELYETNTSLDFTAKIPLKSDSSRDMYERIKGGVIDENSVGIIVTKAMADNADKSIRRIKEVRLLEISAVTLAANDLARITEVKGWNKQDQLDFLTKKYDSLIKFVRKGNITDETGYQIEVELESLKSAFINLTKPSPDTLPSQTSIESGLLNHLLNKFN